VVVDVLEIISLDASNLEIYLEVEVMNQNLIIC
jgi:hypothetical protein